MKHKVFLVITAILAMANTAIAYDFSYTYQGKTLYYNISNEQAIVTSQNASYPYYSYYPTGDLIIPSSVTYNGISYLVTSIGNHALCNCTGLVSVTIPNSVTIIGDWAFGGCSSLVSVTIPNSVTIIGVWAFSGCSSLRSVTIPNSVTEIPNSAFSSCRGLTSVTIPNTVSHIDGWAFSDCTSLRSVTIPNSVINIGTDAFRGAHHIEYHGNATGAPWGAISMNGFTDGDFVFVDTNRATLLAYIGGSDTVVIPSTVTSIGGRAFNSITGMTSVTMPNSVSNIGKKAFYYCTGLTSVIIPESITNICDSAFYGCTSLDTVYVMPTIPPRVGQEAFSQNVYGRVFIIGGCSYYNYYYSSSWNNFRSQIRPPIIEINFNISSSDSNHGIATVVMGVGDRIVRCDTTVVIQATANNGYHFDHWSNGSTTNPDTLHLVGDSLVTAFFERNIYSVIGTTSQGDMGYVTGSDTVYYLDTVILTATANNGYHFSQWNDGNTSNPRVIVATRDVSLTANFSPNMYLLNLYVDTSIHGYCTGAGSYSYLSTRTIYANANYGYHFMQWNDGIIENPRYITLISDTAFTAFFSKNRYTLMLSSSDNNIGSVSGTGEYDYLDTVLISATVVMEHNHFVQWSDGNTDNPRRYVITGDMTLTAIFAKDTHTVNVQSCNIARGMVETTGVDFVYGTPCTVTATAYTGYTFAGWSNGVVANPYIFAVLDDVELTALFIIEGEHIYTVTLQSANPSMGTVSGGGRAIAGSDVVIKAKGKQGYRFVRWNDNNTDSIRTVHVSGDITYTAYFESISFGIDNVEGTDAKPIIFARDGNIIVRDAQRMDVRVYDMMGRRIAYSNAAEEHNIPMPMTGVYLVKMDTLPARKVVVIR